MRLATLTFLVLCIMGCADRTVSDDSNGGSTTGVGESTSTSTEYSTTTGSSGLTTGDSSTGMSTTTGEITTTMPTSSLGEMTSSSTDMDVDCSGYERPQPPSKGLYADCVTDDDCDIGMSCFAFGDPNNPKYAFCTVLDCTSDADCAVEGLGDHACEAKPRCFVSNVTLHVCFLECHTLIGDLCPADMACLATDLGPNEDSRVCAAKNEAMMPLIEDPNEVYSFCSE